MEIALLKYSTENVNSIKHFKFMKYIIIHIIIKVARPIDNGIY